MHAAASAVITAIVMAAVLLCRQCAGMPACMHVHSVLNQKPQLSAHLCCCVTAACCRNVKGSIIIGIMVTALAYFTLEHTWPTE